MKLNRWWLKQKLAKPGRFYGDGGTIHHATALDVETAPNGDVVAVWFRCQPLPFRQTHVAARRDAEMRRMYAESPMPGITGIEVVDPS